MKKYKMAIFIDEMACLLSLIFSYFLMFRYHYYNTITSYTKDCFKNMET